MGKPWPEQQLYHLYQSMLKRCYSSYTPHFHRYGGRGIAVCERWRVGIPRGQGFRNFKADMGPRPDGHTLERKDNDGHYAPDNCKWAPRSEQYRNRSTNVWIEFMGVRMIAKDWARQTGVRDDVIVKRLRRGIPPEIAIFDTGNLHPRQMTNMIEAAAKAKLARTHCKRDHPLSGDNLRLSPQGYRECIACKRLRYLERR